ncbi:MAG: hypothetical protein CME06_11425 [Gemmatimonadetes bacterium]|nr:hypothetical protein [Gemmatimonadota bacterium]
MPDEKILHRFDILCQITRAQHFAWRRAVAELAPDVAPAAVVDRMWELTGEQTGESYARRIDRNQPLARQVAASIVWSSECMGEAAYLEEGRGDEAFVVHNECPWFDWHEKLGLLAEDRPGCDIWFQKTVARVNRELGTDLRCETLDSLPDGGECCRRRFWVA